jgi:hypothetical protein
MRTLHRLTDQALARLQSRWREAPPAALTPQRLAELAARGDQIETRFAIGCDLAVTLQPAGSWTDKLERLLALAETELPDAAASEVDPVLEAPLAEILAAPAARAEIFGAEASHGDKLLLLAGLSDRALFQKVLAAQPRLAGLAPRLAAPLDRLALVLARGRFARLQQRLQDEVFDGFASRSRLQPGDALREIRTFRLAAVYLTARAEPGLGAEAVRDAIVARSANYLEPGFVAALVAPATPADREIARLVTLLENVAGDANRRRALRLLADTLATRRLQEALRERGDAAGARILLAGFSARVSRAGARTTGLETVIETLEALGRPNASGR